MLTFHKAQELTETTVRLDAPSLPPAVVWIDALAPTAEENSFLRRVLGLEPPTLAQMLEIESSSRLYRSHGALLFPGYGCGRSMRVALGHSEKTCPPGWG